MMDNIVNILIMIILAGIAVIVLVFGTIMVITLVDSFNESDIEIGYTTYTILPGDTLWSIARSIESDEPIEKIIYTIRQDNNIDDCGALQIGEEIKLREEY